MRTRPELDMMNAQNKIQNNIQLLEKSQIDYLSMVSDSSSVLELNGGLGLMSEHLSERCTVRLCDDGRLYFTYRRKLFPNSKVIELNISPYALSTTNKLADYVIIHNTEFLEIAKQMAKKAVLTTYDEQIIINSPDNSGNVTKNNRNKKSTGKNSSANNIILDDELEKPNSDKPIDDVNNQPTLDLE